MFDGLSQLSAIWKRLGINQKVSIAVVMLAVVAGIAALVALSRRQVFDLLYSDLEEKDMARVAAYLREQKIPYEIAHGGAAIMVPRERKYDLRLAIADKGMVTGGHVGLEEWPSPGWGASRLSEQMMKRRTLQGELARTITHIEQVAWADVQIAQPEASLFIQDEKPTTAAITVKLHPGKNLNASQVAGICRLAAGSIEGLGDENVTVIDDRGNLLSSQRRRDESSQGAADAQDQQRAYETYLADKAQTMLDRVLGAGKAVVKVSATLDLQLISETKTDFVADNRVAREEKTISKTASGEAGKTGGNSEEVAETAYEIPKIIRTTRNMPGSVTHLAVAVFVDPTYLNEKGEAAARSDQEIQQLAETVKHAVGLVEAPPRNDSLQITAVRFPAPPTPTAELGEAASKKEQREFMLELAKYGSSILAVAIFLVFARFMLKKSANSALPAFAPRAAAISASLPQATLVRSPDEEELEALRERVRETMEHSPETTAHILQSWLNEDGKGA